jgi:hypothetical protein
MARSVIRELQVEDSDFLSEEEHEGFHDKDKYIELTRNSGKVSVIDEWLDSSKTHKISSTAITRQGSMITKTVKSIYDHETGSLIIATVTGTISRTGRKVNSILYERDSDVDIR